VQTLREAGMEVAGEHQLRFMFVAEAESSIQALVAELELDGFPCVVDRDDVWFCLAMKPMTIDVAALDALGRRFLRLGAEKGGEFAGWDRVPTLEEMIAAGAQRVVGVVNAGEVDLERYPHSVSVRLAESIQPVNRGERYEDPLTAALARHEMGVVTGGGSQLTAQGEIALVRLDLQLANLDRALTLVHRTVEELGAPIGSALEFERDGRPESIDVGTHQLVTIYLDGTSLPDEVYAQTDLGDLMDLIDAALDDKTLGEARDYWSGPTETAVYVYGPDAEAMFARIEPVLLRYPLGQNSRVVVKSGAGGKEQREVRIPRRS
jgi:hypothetical protein